ncbi:Protein of unknown function [Pseudobutyrivibrio sp. OR37]|uniref:DUF3969 family protein n=1 Tax=Pseudobutyrivibrio sp. OR37 TaxID=1798186 RepID=UPI0008ED4B8B|nr:DUF3969 family protein [Pseudobutyrivibrio sp. OR37]SFH56584.1 Protein of unknown function [Pseudobutyrivibrio sp. OR37]
MKNEKEALIFIINVLEELLEDRICIDKSEQILFSPFNIKKLQKITNDSRIFRILYEGCELDDINDLIPNEYRNVLLRLKREATILLSEYKDES